MAEEFYRKDYGETPAGYVAVIGFRGGPNEGVYDHTRYEVRLGVRTVGTYDSEGAADTVATALIGTVPEPVAVVAEPTSEPAPVEELAEEPEAAAPQRKR